MTADDVDAPSRKIRTITLPNIVKIGTALACSHRKTAEDTMANTPANRRLPCPKRHQRKGN
jgi:hypothetical protein